MFTSILLVTACAFVMSILPLMLSHFVYCETGSTLALRINTISMCVMCLSAMTIVLAIAIAPWVQEYMA